MPATEISLTYRLCLVFLLAMDFVYGNPTTEYSTEASTSTKREAEDKERILATVRLHNYLRNLDVVKERVAPVTKSDDGHVRVPVDVMVWLASVMNVDDSAQTMQASLTFQIEWRDKAISWNASDFYGVSSVETTTNSIWTPHLFLSNSLECGNILEQADLLNINSNGFVSVVLPIIGKTMCYLDHNKFPYDVQHCALVVYSLSNFVVINLTYMALEQSSFFPVAQMNEWELVNMKTVGIYMYQMSQTIPAIQLVLRRRRIFYNVCFIVPMALTSYTNILVFLVPPESGEKISFLVSIFVSTSVFISFVSDVMPRSIDALPFAMKLLLHVIIQNFVILLATLLVLKLFHSQQKEDNADKVHSVQVAPMVGDKNRDSVRNDGIVSKRKRAFYKSAYFMDRVFFVIALLENTLSWIILLAFALDDS